MTHVRTSRHQHLAPTFGWIQLQYSKYSHSLPPPNAPQISYAHHTTEHHPSHKCTETVTVGRAAWKNFIVAAGIAAGRQPPLWRYLTKLDPLTKNKKNVIFLIVKDGKVCSRLLKHTPKSGTGSTTNHTRGNRPTEYACAVSTSSHSSDSAVALHLDKLGPTASYQTFIHLMCYTNIIYPR